MRKQERTSTVIYPMLRKYMLDHNLTQEEFARMCGVNQGTMSKYVTGRHKISPQMVQKILDVTGMDYSTAFCRTTDQSYRIYLCGTETATEPKAFLKEERKLKKQGWTVVNFEKIRAQLPQDLDGEEYMDICFTILDHCSVVYMLPGWEESKNANRELQYALSKGKGVIYAAA